MCSPKSGLVAVFSYSLQKWLECPNAKKRKEMNTAASFSGLVQTVRPPTSISLQHIQYNPSALGTFPHSNQQSTANPQQPTAPSPANQLSAEEQKIVNAYQEEIRKSVHGHVMGALRGSHPPSSRPSNSNPQILINETPITSHENHNNNSKATANNPGSSVTIVTGHEGDQLAYNPSPSNPNPLQQSTRSFQARATPQRSYHN